MSLFAGLDISVKTTAICVLDAHGRILLETMVDSAPDWPGQGGFPGAGT